MNEEGFIHGLVAFKTILLDYQNRGKLYAQKIIPVVYEFEKVLKGNLENLNLKSLSDLIFTYTHGIGTDSFKEIKAS